MVYYPALVNAMHGDVKIATLHNIF